MAIHPSTLCILDWTRRGPPVPIRAIVRSDPFGRPPSLYLANDRETAPLRPNCAAKAVAIWACSTFASLDVLVNDAQAAFEGRAD